MSGDSDPEAGAGGAGGTGADDIGDAVRAWAQGNRTARARSADASQPGGITGTGSPGSLPRSSAPLRSTPLRSTPLRSTPLGAGARDPESSDSAPASAAPLNGVPQSAAPPSAGPPSAGPPSAGPPNTAPPSAVHFDDAAPAAAPKPERVAEPELLQPEPKLHAPASGTAQAVAPQGVPEAPVADPPRVSAGAPAPGPGQRSVADPPPALAAAPAPVPEQRPAAAPLPSAAPPLLAAAPPRPQDSGGVPTPTPTAAPLPLPLPPPPRPKLPQAAAPTGTSVGTVLKLIGAIIVIGIMVAMASQFLGVFNDLGGTGSTWIVDDGSDGFEEDPGFFDDDEFTEDDFDGGIDEELDGVDDSSGDSFEDEW